MCFLSNPTSLLTTRPAGFTRINDNNWGAGIDANHGLSIPPSKLADGSADYLELGYDGGLKPGYYIMFSYQYMTLNAFINATQNTLWSLSPIGLFFNGATCDYTTVSLAACPPTTCQLATCNIRNIEADFGGASVVLTSFFGI